ncbi:DUF4025 domain-containing protein [Paenibacillus mesophilus]|uniref:YozQ family protein n=1 Tax=Paenibacillus mesophilus TaxID=2582849 RepID=UPI00110E0E83|nr:YozQ family protein [Paenibacillus mesophilus]TMV47778.1 DUF4025 domain-containing protein [Paenibacillus mesophilus]
MANEAKESLAEHAEEVAGHSFDASDYNGSSELSQGLAETREQLADVYAAGTSDGVYVRSRSRIQGQ